MGRNKAGCLTSAGSTTLPIISLYGGSQKQGRLVEVGVFNTTTTEVALKLVRLTSAGTPGTGLTEDPQDPQGATPNCQAFNTHSGAPTLGNDMGYRAVLGAAKGAAVIFTMGGIGELTGATPNGIGLIVENGTGQACQAYMVWDE